MSLLGKVFKGSVQPELQETAEHIEMAALDPQQMMRTPEERLEFHTRANIEQAKMGLVQPEMIMAKARVDAGLDPDNITNLNLNEDTISYDLKVDDSKKGDSFKE